jgi:propanol-preferring alcohol dehydrogenase
LCNAKTFTGYSVNGGYSQFITAKEAYVFRLARIEAEMAPLLCAGIIGYRTFKTALPRPGGRIGFFGFGASAHITLQLATKLGYETVAYSRNESHLALAKELGASETRLTRIGSAATEYSQNLDAALVFAPAGEVVLQALGELKKGGCVAVAAIHMSPIPQIEYDRYLFGERRIVSIESNTRSDAIEFLTVAERLGLHGRVTSKKLNEANEALLELKRGNVEGAIVLDCNS